MEVSPAAREYPWIAPGDGARAAGGIRRRDWLRRRLLALADGCAGLAFAAVLGVAGSFDQALLAALLLPVWLLLAKLHGLYDRDHRVICPSTTDELPQIVWWAIVTTTLVAAGVSLLDSGVDVTIAIVGWAVVVTVAVLLRGAARLAYRLVLPKERVLVVGDGTLAEAASRKLALFADADHVIVGRMSERELESALDEDLNGIERVFLASEQLDEELVSRLAAACRASGLKLSVVPPARAIASTAAQLSHVGDLPVVEYNTWDVSRSTLALKRALDVALASAALLLLAPLMALAALAILVEGGRPVLFRQLRAGINGKPFRMLKFRTMVNGAEARLGELVVIDELPHPAFKLRSDPRVTPVGRFLRRFSIDELPQLVNVLRGQMSLVGPRPEQLELVDRYTAAQRYRLAVPPGMTGPMQVFGRGELDFDERLIVERAYIANLSLRRDLQILAKTLPAVLAGRGAY